MKGKNLKLPITMVSVGIILLSVLFYRYLAPPTYALVPTNTPTPTLAPTVIKSLAEQISPDRISPPTVKKEEIKSNKIETFFENIKKYFSNLFAKKEIKNKSFKKEDNLIINPTPTLIDKFCFLNDKQIKIGEFFNAADGCNKCRCTGNLEIDCTYNRCTPE